MIGMGDQYSPEAARRKIMTNPRGRSIVPARNMPFRNTVGTQQSNGQRGCLTAMEVDMRFRNPGERTANRQLVALTTVAALTCAAAWANPQPETSVGSGGESAVWAPKELTFTYEGHTTKYTCDGLRDKMRYILLELGARQDIQLRSFGCVRLAQPELSPGVSIRMNVLQPAGGHGGPVVTAHWNMVDVLARRDPIDAAGDCELIGQIKQQVLPLFATRNVDYRSTCQNKQLLVGATRLKAQVLVADQGAAADSAAR
jgi:hypothetical protein